MNVAEERRIRKALAAYRKTGARDLPSVKKSVPRVFLNAVDEFVESIEAIVEGKDPREVRALRAKRDAR